jgi:hypothetical protein
MDRVWWVAPQTLSGLHDDHPRRERSLRGKPLRATPYAPCRAASERRLTPLPGTSAGGVAPSGEPAVPPAPPGKPQGPPFWPQPPQPPSALCPCAPELATAPNTRMAMPDSARKRLRLPRARAFSGAATQASNAGFQRLRCVLFMAGGSGRSGTHARGAHVASNTPERWPACLARTRRKCQATARDSQRGSATVES